jgi:hypothetical protein
MLPVIDIELDADPEIVQLPQVVATVAEFDALTLAITLENPIEPGSVIV